MSIIMLQETYPGTPLSIGDTNEHVLNMKIALNVISVNFPAIPKITPVDDTFNEIMEAAVKEFQKIYNLPVTGIIDKATWYQIRITYNAVKSLVETVSIGEIISDIPVDTSIEIDDTEVVPRVQLVQYFLNVLSAYYDTILPVDINGILDSDTAHEIREFQKTMSLPVTGIIDEQTWQTMYRSVLGILRTLPPTAVALPALVYPGIIFQEGSDGPGAFIIQELLSFISTVIRDIPNVESDGIFGPETKNAVVAFQRHYDIEADGIVDEETWNTMVSVYRDLRFGETRSPGQFPGTEIN